MIKLHFTEEWLRKAIANDNDGDESCEAGGLHPEAPRFSIEHGVIHDRNTGKHVRTDNSLHPHQDGIKEAVALLNELDHDARLAPYLHNALDRIRALQADRGRMREALKTIAHSRQSVRHFVEPIEAYITRIKEIADAALKDEL